MASIGIVLPLIYASLAAGHCPSEFRGDGTCDRLCMTAADAFDGTGLASDCSATCSTHCSLTELADTVCQDHCNTWDCEWDRGDCVVCASGCLVSQLGDGTCQPECLSSACGWDWGDCNDQLHPLDTFVTAGGSEGDGSVEAPFNDLLQALFELFLPFNRIVLLEGKHLLNTEDMNFPELLSQRGLINTIVTGSLDSIPTIKLTRHFAGFQISHSVVFSNIYFDGAFDLRESCWDPTCLYCPFTTFDSDREEWINDRNQVIDIAKFAPQTYCNEYHDKVFITVIEDASLTLENVIFANFNQQLKALILNECGNLYLRSVHFDRCMADPSGAGLIQHTISESRLPYNCGEIEYVDGSVYRLNDGYEYRSDVVFSGFLRIEGIQLLKVSNVDFAFNNVMAGEAVAEASSPLIALTNFRQIEISLCEFSNNLASPAFSINSDFRFPLFIIDGVASEQLLTHLNVTDCTFFNNTALSGSIFQMLYKGDHQNLLLQGLRFADNICQSSVVEIRNEQVHIEDWKGATTASGATTVFIPERSVKFTSILLQRNNCPHVFSLSNIGNLLISESRFFENGLSKNITAEFVAIFSRFADTEGHYIQLIPDLPVSFQCSAIAEFFDILNFTYTHNDMDGNYCPYGISGVALSGAVGNVAIHDVSFTNSNGSGALTLIVSEAMTLYAIRCINNINVYDRDSVCLDIELLAPVDVTIKDSQFEGNRGWFSTVLYADNTRTLTLERIQLKNNTAKYTCAGVLFNPLPSGLSRLKITDSEFAGNAAYNYGVVTVMDYHGILAGNVLSTVDINIQNCSFLENHCETQGASISIGTSVSLTQSSLIANCTFLRNSCEEGAALFASFHSGTLTVEGSECEGNYSPGGGALFLNHFPTVEEVSAVRIRKCRFRGQSGGAAVVIEGHSRNSDVFGDQNFFDSSEGAYYVTAGNLTEASSVFQSLTTEEGPVIFAQKRSILHLRNLTANGNLALNRGGAFVLTSHTNAVFENCTLTRNQAAATGGAVYADEDSVLTFRSTVFSYNIAQVASALYASPASVYIANCTIAHNFVTGYGSLFLSRCVGEVSGSRFFNNSSTGNCPGVVISSCEMFIADCEMSDQKGRNGGFMQAIDHNSITIIRTTFRDGSASSQGGAIFATLQSNLLIVSSEFFYCYSAQEGGVISIQSSDLTILNSTFQATHSDFIGGAIAMREGKLVIESSHFDGISPSMGYLFGLELLNITGSTFSNGAGNSGAALTIKNVLTVRVTNSEFDMNAGEIQAGAILLVADGSQSTRDQVTITRNRFRSNSAANTGGAVVAGEVDLHMAGNEFAENHAKGKGGGLTVYCSIWEWCNFTIVDNDFRGNSAEQEGGAISWSGAAPFFSGNTYANNSAPYGFNVASYAVRLAAISPNSSAVNYLSTIDSVPVALRLTDIASGQITTESIRLGLFDHRGVLMTMDFDSFAKLTALNASEVTLSGNTDTESSGGKLIFENFILSADPGSVQLLMVKTDGVDESRSIRARDNAEYHDKVLIEVQFRQCMPGESLQHKECFLCSSGTYSLDPSLPCLICPSAAICYGNNTMVPKSGYWRIRNDTANFIECLAPEACIGSPEPPFISLTGLCAIGYSGNLCQQCKVEYSRTGRFQCSKCPGRVSNVTITTLIILLALGMLALVVWTAIKSAMKPQSLIAIYVKLFMNYLQMVVVSAALNLNWPTFVKTFLNGQQMAGGVAEQLFSFDCMLQDVSVSTSNLYFTKIQSYALLPFLLFVLALATWLILAVCIKIENLVRKLVASAVIILFILHPSLTKMMFSLFACMDLGDGRLWLINDLSIVCWDKEHIKEIFMVVIPTMGVFIFGLPLLTLLVLMAKRAVLDSSSFKLMFCFLYKGYQRERFYWEFVILYRKVAMIAASVFLAPISIKIQALTVLAMLLFSLFLQVQVNPFFEKTLNKLEVKAILVSALTIYSGLYYDAIELNFWLKILLFCVMVVANAYFLVSWIRLISPVLMRTIRERLATVFRWRKNYRIQAMNKSDSIDIQEKPSQPNFSSDLTHPHVSVGEPSPSLDPSYQDPNNTSIVMAREYSEQEEAKEPVHYTLVE